MVPGPPQAPNSYWMDGRLGGWGLDGQTDRQMDGPTNEWADEQMDG